MKIDITLLVERDGRTHAVKVEGLEGPDGMEIVHSAALLTDPEKIQALEQLIEESEFLRYED